MSRVCGHIKRSSRLGMEVISVILAVVMRLLPSTCKIIAYYYKHVTVIAEI